MIKNLTRLEHKIGDRVYHLYCDMDSPINEVKEALCAWLGHVTSIENAAKESAKQAEVKEPEVIEEPKA